MSDLHLPPGAAWTPLPHCGVATVVAQAFTTLEAQGVWLNLPGVDPSRIEVSHPTNSRYYDQKEVVLFTVRAECYAVDAVYDALGRRVGTACIYEASFQFATWGDPHIDFNEDTGHLVVWNRQNPSRNRFRCTVTRHLVHPTRRDAPAVPAAPAVPLARHEPPAAAPPGLDADATAAVWRASAAQLLKLAKDPIVTLLARHLGADGAVLGAKLAAFLDTELGTALFGAALSATLSALPLPPNDLVPRLARELRTAAMARAGDAAVDVLTGPLREVAASYLRGTPETSPPPCLAAPPPPPPPLLVEPPPYTLTVERQKVPARARKKGAR